jgi:hypothetical protein
MRAELKPLIEHIEACNAFYVESLTTLGRLLEAIEQVNPGDWEIHEIRARMTRIANGWKPKADLGCEEMRDEVDWVKKIAMQSFAWRDRELAKGRDGRELTFLNFVSETGPHSAVYKIYLDAFAQRLFDLSPEVA